MWGVACEPGGRFGADWDRQATNGFGDSRPCTAGGADSGLAGDAIGDRSVHGGDDQAVYAYAREDLDWWQGELGCDLDNGQFGENLTTRDVDVTGARIGEQWHIGTEGLVLEVSSPRIPCRTFAAWLNRRGWVKTFTAKAIPGAYLRVISPGWCVRVTTSPCATFRGTR